MIEEFLVEARQKMDQAVEHVQGEFGTIRTGRANPGNPAPGDGRLLRHPDSSPATRVLLGAGTTSAGGLAVRQIVDQQYREGHQCLGTRD